MADFIFDGANKIIKEPVGTGDTTFEVDRDIYSAWKRWVQSGNAQFDEAISSEGGTPIGATGLFTGVTFILINGWKLMAADHDHQVIILGNIYSSDGIVSVPNPVGNSTLFISSTVGAQGISTSGATGGLTPTESQQLSEIHSKLPSDDSEIAGENDVSSSGLTPTQSQQLSDIHSKLPSDGFEIAGENDTTSGGGSSPWTEEEKNQLILDLETTKRQATKAVNNTEKET